MAERLLRREGFAPILVDAPQAALQIARTSRPAAILLDVHMPGTDGWAVLAALKADPSTRAIPVLMLSVLGTESDHAQPDIAGWLTKPLEAGRLHMILDEAMGPARKAGAGS